MLRRHDLASRPSNTVLYISGTTLFFHNQRLLANTETVDCTFESIENWATSQTSSPSGHNPPREKAIVKSELNLELQPHRLHSSPSRLYRRYPKPKPCLLLLGAESGNRFRRVFILTYERWVGTRANPWVIPDHVAIPVLQTIWDAVYMAHGVQWTFEANDPVFNCVNQCLREWRASFKSTAEIMVEQFFESGRRCLESSDRRQEWAAEMLDNSEFVWGDERGKCILRW
ncbi:hypothetical protein EDB87DRAFT_1012581 [Lactarius vividus]|nr:hypothetical protein EDB87DRAFT_1012581 [Lactarius vividus]